MKEGRLPQVLLLLFCCLKGTSSFHGCLTKIVLSNSKFSGRKIVKSEISELVPPDHEQYFIFIHDDDRKHRFLDTREWYGRLRKVLLSKYPNSTVMETYWNWNRLILSPPSTSDVKGVAADYLFFYNSLMDNDVDPKKIIIVGHGYGALIGSLAAKSFDRVQGVKIGRIVAMDPQEKRSVFGGEYLYVTKSKAEVVMAIHTISAPERVPAGSIEFFPNGGKNQPGCEGLFNFCKNTRSYKYLIAAVSYPDHFKAYKCDSYKQFKKGMCTEDPVSLGDLETEETGSFFLKTTSSPPYFKD